jgi:hypothetical protein
MSSTTAAPGKSTRSGGYEVPRGGGKCAVSGRVIVTGEKYFAAIRETETGVERQDVTPECWDAYDKIGLLAFWQTVMPQADEKKKVFVDDEVLCSLFERLADAVEPAKVSFRFVLGLILMRKRLVIYDATRHEPARDIWVVRLKGKPEQMDLLDPKLDEQQMAEVSQQLGQILNEEGI